MTEPNEEPDRQGEIVDAIVREALGPETLRQSPGSPVLSKKEALAVLAFMRAARPQEGKINGDK